jgi:hypothetical protein
MQTHGDTCPWASDVADLPLDLTVAQESKKLLDRRDLDRSGGVLELRVASVWPMTQLLEHSSCPE